MINHWNTPGVLAPGRELLALYVTFEHAPVELHDYIAEVQRALTTHPGLGLVRTEWLHCTVLGLTSREDYSAKLVADLIEVVSARVAEFSPFDITVGSPQIAEESVYLPVSDGGALVELRKSVEYALQESLAYVPLVPLPEPPHGFDPHISVAYAHRDFPSAELVSLSELTWQPVTSEVTSLRLVDLFCHDRQWRWDTSVPLPMA